MILRKALLGTVSVLLSAAWASAQVSPDALITYAEGSWEAAPATVLAEQAPDLRCDIDPIRISIDWQAGIYTYRYNDFEGSAVILDHGYNYLWLQYDGEERVMDDGRLHEWGLFMLDQETFVWVRRDWYQENGGRSRTEARTKCEAPVG